MPVILVPKRRSVTMGAAHGAVFSCGSFCGNHLACTICCRTYGTSPSLLWETATRKTFKSLL